MVFIVAFVISCNFGTFLRPRVMLEAIPYLFVNFNVCSGAMFSMLSRDLNDQQMQTSTVLAVATWTIVPPAVASSLALFQRNLRPRECSCQGGGHTR